LAAALVAAGCVTLSEHEAKVKELDALRAQSERDAAAKRKADAEGAAQQLAEVNSRLKAAQQEQEALRLGLGKASTDHEALSKQLDAQTALASELKKRLEKLGQNVDRFSFKAADARR
jgi:chromosome segregation ATPase